MFFKTLNEARRLAGLLKDSALRAEIDAVAAGHGKQGVRDDLIVAALERRICIARKALQAAA
jgi:chorismate mutase